MWLGLVREDVEEIEVRRSMENKRQDKEGRERKGRIWRWKEGGGGKEKKCSGVWKIYTYR